MLETLNKTGCTMLGLGLDEKHPAPTLLRRKTRNINIPNPETILQLLPQNPSAQLLDGKID